MVGGFGGLKGVLVWLAVVAAPAGDKEGRECFHFFLLISCVGNSKVKVNIMHYYTLLLYLEVCRNTNHII